MQLSLSGEVFPSVGKSCYSAAMRCFIGLLLCLILTGSLSAQTWKEEPKLAKAFQDRGVKGCFVMLDPASNTLHVYNPERAKQQFRPASTFKIPNALIALEVGSVRDLDEVIPYGGTKEWIKEWEQDMNLRDAMKVSNVAVFHQVAKRTGLQRMQERLTAFQYGNQQAGKDIEKRFWLTGPLEISAVEQVEFLHRLTTGKLPVKPATYESVRSITLYEKGPAYAIYGKTGWLGPEDPQIGWWVGWVEKGGVAYPFALNAVIKTKEDAKHRIPMALDCLKTLGVTE